MPSIDNTAASVGSPGTGTLDETSRDRSRGTLLDNALVAIQGLASSVIGSSDAK